MPQRKICKKVKDLNSWEFIHCPTKEEAYQVKMLMYQAGLRWTTGELYNNEKIGRWETYKENTCFCPARGTYADVEYYINSGYVIHKADKFINASIEEVEHYVIMTDNAMHQIKGEYKFETKQEAIAGAKQLKENPRINNPEMSDENVKKWKSRSYEVKKIITTTEIIEII